METLPAKVYRYTWQQILHRKQKGISWLMSSAFRRRVAFPSFCPLSAVTHGARLQKGAAEIWAELSRPCSGEDFFWSMETPQGVGPSPSLVGNSEGQERGAEAVEDYRETCRSHLSR